MCKYALISVFDKQNIVEFAKVLSQQGYHIISTGGTYEILKPEISSDKIHHITSITGFPEILNGRVKTLHPKIFGGILSHRTCANNVVLDSFAIDIVVVNLYPFEKEQSIETIDIGGVSLLRAAAKNWKHVISICDPSDYDVLKTMHLKDIGDKKRHWFATKVFNHVEQYDREIRNYFRIPIQLKYGLNPYQKHATLIQPPNISPLQIINGTPGYINMLDALGAWQLVRESYDALNGREVVASFKHTSPAGVGTGRMLTPHERTVWLIPETDELSPIACAYIRARNGDPLSSFGDFVASSHSVDESMARQLRREVCDGIIAPGFSDKALDILTRKKNGNFIIVSMDPSYNPDNFENTKETRQVFGFELTQERNNTKITSEIFTKQDSTLTLQETEDLILGNIVLKYTQSNAVTFVFHGQIIGVGAGQQNRLECIKIAAKKATIWFLRKTDPKALDALNIAKTKKYKRQEIINHVYQTLEPKILKGPLLREYGIIVCSDAFFPFRDNIDYLNPTQCSGIRIICQPGGSIADNDIYDACEESGRKMITTGIRLFTH